MLILVRPHVSLLDGPAVARFLPKAGIYQAVFAVDPDYARHPVWSRLLNAYGWLTGGHTMLPLDAIRPFAMRELSRILQSGRDVVIFPQGTGVGDPFRRRREITCRFQIPTKHDQVVMGWRENKGRPFFFSHHPSPHASDQSRSGSGLPDTP